MQHSSNRAANDLLADHFEKTELPAILPDYLRVGWKGGFVMLVPVFVISSFLETVPNVVLTPHIASSSVPTRLAMANLAAENLIGYLTNNKPLTPLNPVVLAR